MWLQANKQEWKHFLTAAEVFWQKNLTPAEDDAVILVEAFHQDLRVTLRNLAVANAIRRFRPAKLIVFTGVEEAWRNTLWQGFNVSLVRQLASAYGAAETIDVWDVVRKSDRKPTFDTSGYVAATDARLAKLPRLRPQPPQERQRYGDGLAAFYEEQFKQPVVALVTSHVDYDQWGLAVEVARRSGVPVIHTQQTGCLKAYALFPENDTHTGTFREELTRQIADVFETKLWPRHEELRRATELIAWRSKVNLGRPSWWRGGATASVDLNNPAERAVLRAHTAARFGFDPDKPIVAVFNHAVSDALGTNRELFPSLADWFTETAAWAAQRDDAQWMFLDHPSQALYDSSGFFDALAKEHVKSKHMVFKPSASISKNALWSLTDLGVTVRGSVSNELPAYGIPVIQAGWSEWSSCGLSTVVDSTDGYFKTLDESLTALRDGATLVSEEQVRRARLWLWLYRSGADVVTPQVPQWEVWPVNTLLKTVRATFRHIESDADPLFETVERMWTRREPMLTRTDLS
ncbi:hypothetical protein AMIS_4420 [Actinoplanes missouriensis 431]|uniref:Capsule polysaccharide biosynthesis protein n=1 Tax=Actinoplanes missouriensis (strain ATCC 14538 / DSM 43046 / CBS 188.64 / JCM 3121 / NBRC 102363 / NCIMB 12654 / NRRL B-3342 / UNCC 431) TaxID=512565 RepID=I0GY25_ACTM4|nr:hypothetical protein [Actinoplanes missouriensis]BAL85662.1 hypothetical protein AMIS_4420 [Actinoplanes missouriensis 431]